MKKYLWLVVSLFSLLLYPAMAFGHATVISSNPSPNEALDTLPEKITIQFNENIQPAFHSLEVFSQDGDKIQTQDSTISEQSEKILEAKWKGTIDEGIYYIKWRVVSSDGHPIEGTIPFQFGNSAGLSDQNNSEVNESFPNSINVMLQSLQYICFAALTGILFFRLSLMKDSRLFEASRRTRLYLWLSYAGLAFSIFCSLPLRVTIDAGVGWTDAFNVSYIKEVLNATNFGTIWIMEILILLLLFLVIYFMLENSLNKSLPFISFIIIASLMICKAFTGHTAAVPNQALAVLMDFLHLLSMALWLGGLLALLVILPGLADRQSVQGDKKTFYWSIIQRFSKWAFLFVIILIISGIYSSLQHVPTIHSLFNTTYGQLLLAKIGLMLIMIVLGGFHFLRGKKQTKKLGYSVGMEFGLGIVILLIAALLTNVQTAMSSPGPIEKTLRTEENNEVTLMVTPNEVGDNLIQVKLSNEGKPIAEIEQLTITMQPLDTPNGEIKLQMKEKNTGTFTSKSILTMPGKWNIHVHGLTESLDSINADFIIFIGNS
ncbi:MULTISPECIES: copper resistance CopC/CopD family protein [unclassified Bacillus (in: firmicutes)]|uniref:copper resistance CopC/CopD family protein n=1 Tax=unclassified Bacillus (in: firmicutes) TaxID=185979 RepID=UPI001BE575B3|nr:MULTISPECIES: copper resistance CopC/CopD family protein [unclassified Bacillus (in: firmicutes)]MBT2614257.1 copper resistance protein CopC [Bacillus sp. ISL-78]MBT2632759.1 copper resistance protein CopC [Bacillus sp. ISL-101]